MPTNRFTWTLRLGSDYATFLRQVQERVAGQVMSRTDSVHRERELTQNNEELYRLWAAWTNMPLRAQASVTLRAIFQRSGSRVDSITFSAVSPVPPLEIDCDIDTVTAVAPSDGPADVTAGVTGTPQQGWVGQVLSYLDITLQGAGAIGGLAEIAGLSAAEFAGAAIGTAGAPIAIFAGVAMLGERTHVRDSVAYFRGYVLAMADMAQPNNPNARRSEPGWYARGRRRAIRHINRNGMNGLRTLARLKLDYPSMQSRVNFLWEQVINVQFSGRVNTQQLELARSLRPTV